MRRRMILVIAGFFIVAIGVSFYLSAMPLNVTDSSGNTPELHNSEKSQWVKHWDELDLTAIKRVYQPYTVAEMRKMWETKLIAKYGGIERFKQAIGEADSVYPQDTYLARMLELGRPFVNFSDYEKALTDQRIWLFSTRVYWESMNATQRAKYLRQHGLPPDATWDMYEKVLQKDDVVYSINFWRSMERDPYMNGTLSCFDITEK